jgi:hypothetical protein
MNFAPQIAALGLVTLLFAGCKSTYTETDLTPGQKPPLLRNTTRVYVALPHDATFKKTVAQGSGKQTAEALFVAFSKYSRLTSIAKFPESASEAIESARQWSADYLLYPTILKWEDRATEYSGRRDRLELKVELIDLKDSKVVFSRNITGTGKWMTDGGDSPADLLEQPVEEFANSLFRRVEKPSALW